MNINKIIEAINDNYKKYMNSPRDYTIEKIEDNWIEVQHFQGSIVDFQIYENEIYYQVDTCDTTDPREIYVERLELNKINDDHTVVCSIIDYLLNVDLDDYECDYEDMNEFTDGCKGRHEQFWHDCKTMSFV